MSGKPSSTRGGCSRRAFLAAGLGLTGARAIGHGVTSAHGADSDSATRMTLAGAAPEIELSSLQRRLLALPLRDRVAQLFVFEAVGTEMTPAYEERLVATKPGGVLFVGPNIGTPDQLAGFVAAIHATNPSLPPLVTVDQEGGPVTRVPGDPVPGAAVLGQETDQAVEDAVRVRSTLLDDYGFDVNFAPVADVAFDGSSSMVDRSFGSDPDVVARKVAAVVAGTRGTNVIGAAKHFPGHGRTTLDSHYALPRLDVSYEEWLATDALPFKAAIAAGVPAIMLGHLVFSGWEGWGDDAASFSPVAVRTLRRDLGFGGVIVTDDLGMDALSRWNPFEVVDRAIDSGVDVLLYAQPPAPDADLIGHVVARVEAGEITEDRIAASLLRLARMRSGR